MLYWDNAATTWPKPAPVIQAVTGALTRFGANPGRGGHTMGMEASQEVYRCRETAARLFHLENPGNVVFTLNCTMSLNFAIKGILRGGGRVVVSDMEHNAVMRPLYALSPGRPLFDIAAVVPGDEEATVANFRRSITPFTKAIVCTQASNVFGVQLPIRRLGALAREYNLLFVVDAAQSAGVLPLDMEADSIDFLCVPGHKGLYGPMGTGLLLSSGRFSLPTLLEGGTGSQSRLLEQPDELPDRLESGTVNVPGICGLRAGMEWVMARGTDAIRRQELHHLQMLYDRLIGIPGVALYTARPEEGKSAPVLSLNLEGRSSTETAAMLNRYGVAVRAGLHCAPCAHRKFGTLPAGTVRFAPSLFTSAQQVEQTARILRRCAAERGEPAASGPPSAPLGGRP